MKALLLIDIQNDFLPGGALAVPDGDQIIPIVNHIQPPFDLIVATQDWHPPDHKSFASNHAGRKVFETIDLEGLEQALWPDHCVQGTYGAEFSKQLDMKKVEAIFRKGTNADIDSYSGFYDNGHRKSTGLTDYLRGKNITQLYIAGLAGDYCVYYSAKDAIKEGFDTYIIEDATKAIDTKKVERVNKDIVQRGGKVIISREIA